MIFIGLFWVVLLVGVGFIVYALFTRWQHPHALQGGPGREDPLTVLKLRYARGEITREQYQQMRRDLMDLEP